MFDVEKIVQENDLSLFVEKAGGRLEKGRCACPLHGGHDVTAFSVYSKDGKQLWRCHSGECGGGDVISFIMAWQNKTFIGACEFLDGKTVFDHVEMESLARIRHEAAVKELEESRLKEEARRHELQLTQRHLYYHEHMKEWGIEMWNKRGLNECYQGLFFLGTCEDFNIGDYHTPTLTIPIFDEHYELLNIKHRLINPQKENDKYRPEKSGLGAFPPIMAFPDLGYRAKLTWVVEGEIKALVAATITADSEWQFIGVPGRNQYKSLTDKLQGNDVIVIPDPGAEKDAWEFCKSVGGRFVRLPEKVDDMIIGQGYDADWLKYTEKWSRR